MWHLEDGGKKEYEYGSRTMTDDDLEIGGRRGGTAIEGGSSAWGQEWRGRICVLAPRRA